MKLENLGWNPAFGDFFAQNQTPGLFPARVSFASRDRWRLIGVDGEFGATLSGKARNNPELPFPVVGDWVLAQRADEQTAVIHDVLPRQSVLSRGAAGGRRTVSGATEKEQVLASNVSQSLIVCGLDRDYNPRRIERYIAMCYGGGVQPVILLNKADIGEDPEGKALEISKLAPGIEVLAICAHLSEDVERVRQLVQPCGTICLLGSSGAGKSTLLNALCETTAQSIKALSLTTSKGRHTTTHRELFPLPGGSVIIDTPGLREVALAGEDGLEETFAEIEDISRRCRFRDCSHGGEPDCAVMEAVKKGLISPERWNSYERLRLEVRYRQVASAVGIQAAERNRWKSISKAIKQHYNSKIKL